MVEITEPKRLRILIADDDEEDKNLIKIAFEEMECPLFLEFVSDGVELMNDLNQRVILRKALPDVILLDLNMPKKDGKAALKEIKENNLLKYIYVIILSTSNLSEDKRYTQELGANSYYTKPADYILLLDMAKEIYSEVMTSMKINHEETEM